MSQEIVKVTSKGQLTIPASIRGETGLKRGSYIYMKSLGKLIIMKKVDDLSLDEISSILQEVAQEKGLTKALLAKDVERVRSELWKEKYGKGKSPSRH
jgi:AbrB family looped-hinge helix DNA binding protein